MTDDPFTGKGKGAAGPHTVPLVGILSQGWAGVGGFTTGEKDRPACQASLTLFGDKVCFYHNTRPDKKAPK